MALDCVTEKDYVAREDWLRHWYLHFCMIILADRLRSPRIERRLFRDCLRRQRR